MSDFEDEAFEKLTGKYKHFCYEFDGLAIDETCWEFSCCTCQWVDASPEEKKEIELLKNKVKLRENDDDMFTNGDEIEW